MLERGWERAEAVGGMEGEESVLYAWVAFFWMVSPASVYTSYSPAAG